MKEHGMLYTGAMVRGLLRAVAPKTQTRRVVKLATVHADCGEPVLEEAWVDPSYLKPELGGVPCLKVPFRPTGQPEEETSHRHFPKWEVGDRIWVKETFQLENTTEYFGQASIPTDGRPIQRHEGHELIPRYRSTEPDTLLVVAESDDDEDAMRWRPSIFMPRWASRITLEVVKVRVERVQEISEADAIAEGIERLIHAAAKQHQYWKNYSFETAHPRHGTTITDDRHRTLGYSDAVRSYRSLWNSINAKPRALYGRVAGKRVIVGYEAYPWGEEDFDGMGAAYAEGRRTRVWHGKPLRVLANPWVWVVEFRRVPEVQLPEQGRSQVQLGNEGAVDAREVRGEAVGRPEGEEGAGECSMTEGGSAR